MSISCNAVRDIFVLYRDGALRGRGESAYRILRGLPGGLP